MTNTELLNSGAPAALLTRIEGQRLFVLRQEISRAPCPSCGHMCNTFEATGTDVDDYDFGATPRPAAKCPGCKRGLRHVLPFFGGRWHWAVKVEPAQ